MFLTFYARSMVPTIRKYRPGIVRCMLTACLLSLVLRSISLLWVLLDVMATPNKSNLSYGTFHRMPLYQSSLPLPMQLVLENKCINGIKVSG